MGRTVYIRHCTLHIAHSLTALRFGAKMGEVVSNQR
jgi:hypothetical protein